MQEPTIALLDLDQIVYACAHMAEGKGQPTSFILNAAKQMAAKRCKEVKKLCPTVKEFKLFISHPKNFRKEIDTEIPYKGSRPPKPEAVDTIREYFVKKGAKMMPYLEADDHTAMNHWASWLSKSYKTVLVDQDKDLDQVPGHRIVPSLTRKGRVTRQAEYKFITEGQANLSFYRQLLIGDGCDDIPGIEGFGAGKAAKILPNEACPNTLYAKVLDTYLEYYQDLCYSEIVRMIFERGNLLYMKKFPNDIYLPPRQGEIWGD